MIDKKTGNGSGFGKGMLIGGLIGAAIAFFYAPKSGADLRKDIRKRANGLRTNLDRYARQLKEQTNGLLGKAITTINEARGEAVHVNRRTRQQVSNH
jgi:gas vesicle protein